MAIGYFRKLSSLSYLQSRPNAAGVGMYGGSVFVQPGSSPMMLGPVAHGTQKMYFVDQMNGSDSNDGRSWDTAKATIQAAVDLARYPAGSTTLIYTDKDRHAYVFVAPGHYDEQVLFSGYNIHLIGCGVTPGKDWGPCINYSGAVAATGVLGFSGSGIEVSGFYVNCAAAIPAILMAGGDNNWVHDCVIEGDGTLATYGIQTYSLKQSRIDRCVINNFKTHGIFLDGGADRYAINGGIRDCQINMASSAGAKGIYAENTMTAYNFVIDRNFINARGGGATGKGIDLDCTGIMVTDNYVFVADTATAIENADTLNLHNHTNDTDTFVDPYPAAS